MNTVKLNKKVLSYKDYIVFETLIGDYEVHDYTFKTPTTWLCHIFEKSKYTLDKAKAKIEVGNCHAYGGRAEAKLNCICKTRGGRARAGV